MAHEREQILSTTVNFDPIYQQLLKDCLLLEPEYIRILDSLSKKDKELLERYISLCEEMDHRRLSISLTI